MNPNAPEAPQANPTLQLAGSAGLSRRRFLATGTAVATGISLVPRQVLGGPGFVAPSEQITLAHIGCGSQGLRELPGLLDMPQVRIVAACDPVKESYDYVDWSRDGLRAGLGRAIGQPDWKRNAPGIPGGRDILKEVVELAYAKRRPQEKFSGCATYADFRELLEQEKDVNAVKIMTPDHLHATIAVAAMNHGKHVVLHKPLANRLNESRLVIETARKTGVGTHFLPASDGADIRTIKAWIEAGAIGQLREIHNWSNRPVWPQYPTLPTDQPPVPSGFDWNLWLGPSPDRPYHPHYTHAVFRGWYEFGGGAIADMGHYSLWPVFVQFDLDSPVAVESRASHLCGLAGQVPFKIHNDYSFPAACTVRFKFAAKGNRPAVDLFWYDGSMKPPTPEELETDGAELEAEGMMFVGERGKILARFRGEDPRLIPATKMREFQANKAAPSGPGTGPHRTADWVAAFKSGPPTCGDFLLGRPISDAFNLAAVSLRLGGRKLLFDATAGKITNLPEANRYLTREYRKGWELPSPA